jgi:hypothetical protein
MFCASCGTEYAIGDGFCRKCGRSLTMPTQTVHVSNVYRGKNIQLGGIGLAIVAILLFLSGLSSDDRIFTGIGAFGAILGLILFLVGRFEHWYHAE